MDGEALGHLVQVTFTQAQLRVLAGCISETLDALDDREFATRLGVDRAAILDLRVDLDVILNELTEVVDKPPPEA